MKRSVAFLLAMVLALTSLDCGIVNAGHASTRLGENEEQFEQYDLANPIEETAVSGTLGESGEQAEKYELAKPEGVPLPEIPLEDREAEKEQEEHVTLHKGDAQVSGTDGEQKQDASKLVSGKDAKPRNMRDIAFRFQNTTDIMSQYVTKKHKTAKLLNNHTLYSYDIKSKKAKVEYQFPETQYFQGGNLDASQDLASAYIREDAGLLYYAYNSYRYTFSEDEIINVMVYDLEKGKIVRKVKVKGHILACVGADRKGNIYIATKDEWENGKTKNSLLVLSPKGKKICQKKLEYPINSFSGFCKDGTFFYIDEYMVYSMLGYPNLMGLLRKGKFKGNKITLNNKRYLAYAKNIFFGDYQTPVEIINDKYLVTYTGGFYPLSKITEKSWSQSLYTERKLEMGKEYEYIYNAGVNAVIKGDDVYSLFDNNTIYVYSMKTGKKKKIYHAKAKIFNFKQCGNALLALETDGTHFFYEKIPISSFKKLTTKTYHMEQFSVYKGRTKEDIVNQFIGTAPANMNAGLYAKKGSAKKPYKESALKASTKKYALRVSNYYRWLAGLTPFKSASDAIWNKAGKGAILLSASEFSHTPSRPSDMGKSFYKAAYEGTSNSSIAMNYSDKQYKIVDTIRQFMNDTSYTMPGHRNNFLTRNATEIAYGIYSYYLCQTVKYKNNPNPSGTAVIDNNEAAYGWPAAGYFPSEELSVNAYWTVNLNTDKLSLSNVPLKVTITDLATGKTYRRTSSADNLYATDYWGKFISFAPPSLENGKLSYQNKKYKVKLTNLSDKDGRPATLEYTVKFFSYKTGSNGNAACDEYGRMKKLGAPKVSVSNTESGIKVSWNKKNGAKGYYVYRNGKRVKKTTSLSFTDTKAKKNGAKYQYKVAAYKGKVKGKESKTKTYYYISKPVISSIKRKSNGDLAIKWKRNAKSSGYQIQYTQGKKVKKVTVSGGKKVSRVLKDVGAKKACKISLRAYKTVGKTKYYSVWGKGSIKAAKVSAPAMQKVTAKSYNSLQLQWKQVKGASGYNVYRKNGTSKYKKIATISKGTQCTYLDKKVSTGTAYTYKVKAYKKYKNETVWSPYPKKGISGKAYLSKPVIKSMSANGTGKLDISWEKVDGASGYMLYRSDSKEGSYKLVTTLKGNGKLTFQDTGLGDGKVYYYKLKAFRVVGGKDVYSPYSAVKKGRTEEEKEIFAEGIVLNHDQIVLGINQTVELKATIVPKNVTNRAVEWSSSNTSIASVEQGIVTGKAPGKTIITAKTINGKTAVCEITITSVSVPSNVEEGLMEVTGQSDSDVNTEIAEDNAVFYQEDTIRNNMR